MANETQERVELLVDYIMKNCLWQFHSRAWDREKQNAGIMLKTRQLLCEEPVDLSTPADRCYWVDAMVMAETWRQKFDWINTMDKAGLTALVQTLHERLNFLTITGSLNAELTDKRY
ncbi:Fe-only nitrogenase subunit delta [Affinibrenneria salicis]|uniref:Nitrogenase iron-iron protein delta chain n=1 Tax=Affinibrenneria salicis TaxID=2590031 RepID=A0A5J5G1G8_9GAMM|nr:Fe-only nitrogenase subunit delta [Affinibrenneria salicis]KAA9000501.1 Fe-only nitrogenase subunit delta [Affinibrenneria salicis]